MPFSFIRDLQGCRRELPYVGQQPEVAKEVVAMGTPLDL
jgi:hypothetical protein